MLTKNQALAAADALILRAETERRERLERRTARLVMLYPVLKRVPAEDREALVLAARKRPKTRWVMCAVALFAALAGLWAMFGGPALGVDPENRPYLLVAVAGALIAPAQYLCIRAFLRSEVPMRYGRKDEHASRPGA